jgi:hypothetical protein
MERPRMPNRPKSSSIIPKDKDVFQRDRPEYPPDDARAMSPRRDSHDLEKLSAAAKENLKECVRYLEESRVHISPEILLANVQQSGTNPSIVTTSARRTHRRSQRRS